MADFAKIPKASVKQSYSRLFPISNDFFLVLCVGGLVACTIWEVRYQISQRKNKRKTSESATPKCLPKYNISLSDMSPAIFSPPIHNGCTSLEKIHLDPLTMAMYMPLNVYISTTTSSSGYSSSRLVNNNTNSSQQQNANNSSNLSTTSAATSSSDVPPQTTRAPSQADSAALEQLATKMSILPGCEPGSPAALELQQKYPSLSTGIRNVKKEFYRHSNMHSSNVISGYRSVFGCSEGRGAAGCGDDRQGASLAQPALPRQTGGGASGHRNPLLLSIRSREGRLPCGLHARRPLRQHSGHAATVCARSRAHHRICPQTIPGPGQGVLLCLVAMGWANITPL